MQTKIAPRMTRRVIPVNGEKEDLGDGGGDDTIDPIPSVVQNHESEDVESDNRTAE